MLPTQFVLFPSSYFPSAHEQLGDPIAFVPKPLSPLHVIHSPKGLEHFKHLKGQSFSIKLKILY